MLSKFGLIGVAAIAAAMPTVVARQSAGPETSRGTLEVLRSQRLELMACAFGPHNVAARALNVRSFPVNGAVVDRLPNGARVTVTDCDGSWAEIGPGLWVHAGYLTAPAPPRPPEKK